MKKRFKKAFTKRRLILSVLYLVIMTIVQLSSNYLFENNLYVVFGMMLPVLFSDPVSSIFGKYKKAWLFYMNVLVRFFFLAIAAGFVLNGIDSGIFINRHHYLITGLVVSFAVFSAPKLTYSFAGILGVNLVGAFLMGGAYPQFAIGFLAFFTFELVRGQQFRFFAFNSRVFFLNFSALTTKKRAAFIVIILISGSILLLNSTPYSMIDVYAMEFR